MIVVLCCGVVWCGMAVLSLCAAGRKEAQKMGIPALVIGMMQKYPQSARIQERGAGVLRHIASEGMHHHTRALTPDTARSVQRG
jgi:hypothetical protein